MDHNGVDLYTGLPILSACLGHHSLSATERYVRLTYAMYPEMERQCSPATRNYRLAAIHALVSYLQYNIIEQSEEWQKILSIKAMRTEKKALNYLSPEGIRLLLQQPDVTTRQGRRHLAMLSLMYDTGARVQEVADLTVDCIRIDSEPYTIRLFGKGRKARVIPMVKEQVGHLRQYMEENRLDSSNMFGTPLFHIRLSS